MSFSRAVVLLGLGYGYATKKSRSDGNSSFSCFILTGLISVTMNINQG